MRAIPWKLNQVDHGAEYWHPPGFSAKDGPWQRFLGAVRRILDLQAGSIWADLKPLFGAINGAVLDVGCGAQPYRRLLPPHVQYIGIDRADAKEHFGYETPDTIYFNGETWPVLDQSVDVLLCTETLEHVLTPEKFLAEARRCLRPGGRLILTVPFAARWHFVPHDYWRFTPSSLKHLMDQAHFEGVEIYARGNPLTVACYKAMALLLPLLLSHCDRPSVRWMLRLVGVLTLPLLGVLALVGTVSLRSDWGEDCLGYTLVAERGRAENESPATRAA